MIRKIIFLIVLLSFSGYGLGLKVSPGTILLREFPVGDSFDFEKRRNLTLTIKNDNSSSYKYVISPEKPSKSNSDATGYFDIANPDWFSVEPETLVIDAHDVGYANMYMKVPRDENWYNRHWLLGVSILPVSTPKGRGASIALGGYLLYRFETESKGGLNIYPKCQKGEVVSIPSAIHFEDVKPGKTYIKKVKLAHSYQYKKKFSAYPLDPSSEVAKLTILTKSPFTRLQNHSWLEYDENITLQQGQFADFVLRLHIPDTTNEYSTLEGESGDSPKSSTSKSEKNFLEVAWETITSPFIGDKDDRNGKKKKKSPAHQSQVQAPGKSGGGSQYERKKWEEIIMFEGNNTKKSFLRVLITLK